jgi:hypothetical protein
MPVFVAGIRVLETLQFQGHGSPNMPGYHDGSESATVQVGISSTLLEPNEAIERAMASRHDVLHFGAAAAIGISAVAGAVCRPESAIAAENDDRLSGLVNSFPGGIPLANRDRFECS